MFRMKPVFISMYCDCINFCSVFKLANFAVDFLPTLMHSKINTLGPNFTELDPLCESVILGVVDSTQYSETLIKASKHIYIHKDTG